jgi:hypothetical protein
LLTVTKVQKAQYQFLLPVAVSLVVALGFYKRSLEQPGSAALHIGTLLLGLAVAYLVRWLVDRMYVVESDVAPTEILPGE